MNREYLKSLGLSDADIDAIMARYGQAIQAQTTAAQELQTQLTTTQAQLTEAQANVATLTTENATLTAQNTENAEFKAKYHKERLNTQLLGEGAKSKYLDVLNAHLVDVPEDKLTAKIGELKADLAELFGETTTVAIDGFKVVDNKLTPGQNAPQLTKEKIMAIEDQKERQATIAKNLDLFK